MAGSSHASRVVPTFTLVHLCRLCALYPCPGAYHRDHAGAGNIIMRSVSLLRRVMRDLHLYVDTSELRDEAQEGVQREEYGVAAGLDSKSKLVQAIIRSAIGNVKDKEQKLQESQQRRKRAASSLPHAPRHLHHLQPRPRLAHCYAARQQPTERSKCSAGKPSMWPAHAQYCTVVMQL